MKKAKFSRISLLLLMFVFFGSVSSVQSQDLFREMDQIKRELADTRNELQNLKNLVYEMRKVLLESVTAPQQQRTENVPPQQTKVAKEEVNEEQLTKIICSAVGTFFSEAEAALRMSNADAAQSAMSKAFRKLTSSLKGYTGTHRVTKLLNIYDGLTWDTYTAVELRQSIPGNADFLEVLNKHRQKFRDTCPKQ
ncbi:MAG TPA: hypothetical protein VK463_03125 [Desulfomonilaceae bacterium]|nr:hypothetical protein [Desulfomonilaceae bacterium]